MGPIDALGHLLNLFVPALGMALVLPTLAKALWWRPLRAVRWRDLALWVGAAGAAALLLGLGLQGRDGRMSTYVGLVIACAVALWWRGWHHRGDR